LVAELHRRQSVEYPSSSGEAFEGNVSLKHKPILQVWAKEASITVSLHPMMDSHHTDVIHYIDTLYALDQNGKVASLRRLSPHEEAPAIFTFAIPEGVTSLTPYEHCNKHGLFKGDTVAVSSDQTTSGALSRCSLEICENVSLQDCASTGVELLRQHQVAFNVPLPFSGNSSVKHKPYLTLSDTTATVVVGLGALEGQDGQPVHPMVPSTNPAEVHWVDHIYVKNQDGVVVAMRDLDATETSPATLTFQVPAGTTQLVAYEHCNKHGLFVGDMVAVSSNQTAVGQNATCKARFCSGFELISTATFTTTAAITTRASLEDELDTTSNAMKYSIGAVIAMMSFLAGMM
jgi:desulfoferrodoxin (superoxide reductase-like protein)